jgi:hypothetical protein
MDNLIVGTQDGEKWQESYSGAGPVESITGLVDAAIKGDGMTIGGQAVSLGLQALGFMDNPMQSLATSAIGWIIEHLAPLNVALDVTTGDPAAVERASDEFAMAAKGLDDLAVEHANSLKSNLSTYFTTAGDPKHPMSRSAKEFHGVMSQRLTELQTASAACSGTASFVTFSGALVATTRGVIRDMLAEWVWQTLKKGAAMSAAAPLTWGAAAAYFAADRAMSSVKLLRRFVDLLGDLAKVLKRVAGKLKDVSSILNRVLTSPLRSAVVSNTVTEYGKMSDTVIEQDRPDSAAEMPPLPAPPNEPPRETPTDVLEGPPPPKDDLPVQGPGITPARWTASGTLDE